jgi:type IV secretion system protein VirD4
MLELLEETWRLLKDVFERFNDNPGKLKGHHGKFTHEREIISSRNTGFSVTGAKNLSNKQSYSGMMAIASTGLGKSAVVCIPSIMTAQNASFVINDPSGELLTKTSGYLESQGFDIKVLNFADAMKSSGFNPLKWTNTPSKRRKLAHMLLDVGLPSAKDPFWNLIAAGLITNILNVLSTQDEQYRTLHNAYMLLVALAANPKGVDKLFVDHASEVDFLEFKSFLSADERVQSSAIQTAKTALQIFADDNVGKITSFDSLDLASFRTKPTALYVRTSIGDAKFFSGIVSVFFQEFISSLLERFPTEDERDIFFILDEVASLKIPVLPIAMANVRKHRVAIQLLCQSEQQLIENFGKSNAESIMSNAVTKLYFTGQDIETAQRLETILGKVEYVDEEDNNRKNVVPLLSADTIRSLPLSKALLISGHHRAALVKLYPYYENPKLRRYSQMPPTEIKCQLPFFNIPVLPLETPDDDEE